MQSQPSVLRTLSQPATLQDVRRLLSSHAFPSRTALADHLCESLDLRSPLGAPQRSSCLAALRRLDARGRIELPPAWHAGGSGQPRLLGQPVAAPVGLPASVELLQGLRLDLVSDAAERLLYNQLLHDEHPQGAVCHASRQLRYLVRSDHGLLGAVGLVASALALKDRDQWIGWDPDTRLQNLSLVLGLSRFLVRPAAPCANLASKALALCVRRAGVLDGQLRLGRRAAAMVSHPKLSVTI